MFNQKAFDSFAEFYCYLNVKLTMSDKQKIFLLIAGIILVGIMSSQSAVVAEGAYNSKPVRCDYTATFSGLAYSDSGSFNTESMDDCIGKVQDLFKVEHLGSPVNGFFSMNKDELVLQNGRLRNGELALSDIPPASLFNDNISKQDAVCKYAEENWLTGENSQYKFSPACDAYYEKTYINV
jgi:hypothetical protein